MRGLPRLAQLDGIRALAIVMVICDHLSPTIFPGSFLGVNVFFVLSGFLITVVLLSSVREDGQLPYRPFYVRRARRLLPAVTLLLGYALVYALITTRGHSLRAYLITIGGALFYVVNWAPAFGHQVPAQLDHLWSLSVEEQFYLLWPIALMALVRKFPARRALQVTLLLAALSWILRAAVWSPSHQGLAYESTVTRADALLLGCLLGQAYARRLCDGLLDTLRRHAVFGWLGLLGTVAFVPFLQEASGAPFTFGIGISSLASLLLIVHLVGDGTGAPSLLGRILAARPVAALGRRAYSIYLWQNPVMFWLDKPLATSPMRWPVNVVLTLLCAEFSYRFVEQPFLRRRASSPVEERKAEMALGHEAAPAVLGS